MALGLLEWFGLQATVVVYAVGADVVRARHLWPRSLVPPPLTDADKAYYTDAVRADASGASRGLISNTCQPTPLRRGTTRVDRGTLDFRAAQRRCPRLQQDLSDVVPGDVAGGPDVLKTRVTELRVWCGTEVGADHEQISAPASHRWPAIG